MVVVHLLLLRGLVYLRAVCTTRLRTIALFNRQLRMRKQKDPACCFAVGEVTERERINVWILGHRCFEQVDPLAARPALLPAHTPKRGHPDDVLHHEYVDSNH